MNGLPVCDGSAAPQKRARLPGPLLQADPTKPSPRGGCETDLEGDENALVIVRVATKKSCERSREILLNVVKLPVPLRGRVCQLVSMYLTAIPTGLPEETTEMFLSSLAQHISEPQTTPQTEDVAVNVMAQVVQDLAQLRGGLRVEEEQQGDTALEEPAMRVVPASSSNDNPGCAVEARDPEPPAKKSRGSLYANPRVEATTDAIFKQIMMVSNNLQECFRGRLVHEVQDYLIGCCRARTRQALAAANLVQRLMPWVTEHDVPKKLGHPGKSLKTAIDDLLDELQATAKRSKRCTALSDNELIRRIPELQ